VVLWRCYVVRTTSTANTRAYRCGHGDGRLADFDPGLRMAVASGTVRIEINELEEPSDHVVPKINRLHQVSFDDVLDVCESSDHAVLNDDADRGLRLLVRGRLRGRTVRVILYPIDIDRGTWRLATAFFE